MFELFGRNRKSLKEMMSELDEMIGSLNQEFSSISHDESEIKEGSNENGEWKTETYTSPNGMFRYVITTTYGTPNKKSLKKLMKFLYLKKRLKIMLKIKNLKRLPKLEIKSKNLKRTKMKSKNYKPNWTRL